MKFLQELYDVVIGILALIALINAVGVFLALAGSMLLGPAFALLHFFGSC